MTQPQNTPDPKPFLDFFRDHVQEKREISQESKVVLTSLLGLPDKLVSQFLLTNYLAEKQQAHIEGFDFTGTENELITQFLEVLTDQPLITLNDCIPLEGNDILLIAEWRKQIKGKREFLELCFDELQAGRLIYNSYCRYYITETLDLNDERLWGLVEHALGIYRLMNRYFETNDVCHVLLDHPSYFRNGIICCIARARNIPVMTIGRRKNMRCLGNDVDPNGRYTNFASLPWRLYRRLFEQLSTDEQETALRFSREKLAEKLGLGMSSGEGAWEKSSGAGEATPIFRESLKPRILILPPDFCDEIHRYGKLIHVDFYEWLDHILTTAAETDFDWYVKKHPENTRQTERTALNRDVMERFEQRFPKVTFLPSTTSNSQMVAEGIRTVFTVRGSPVHEFAYLGIPVVCGGDTMHMSFDFSLKPQSKEELEELVRSADQTVISIDQAEVEAFYYMNNFYFNSIHFEHITMCKESDFIFSEIPREARKRADFFDVLMNSFDEKAWGSISKFIDAFLESSQYYGDDLAKAKSGIQAQ